MLEAKNWEKLEHFLGSGFDWRIFNKFGDFVFIEPSSLKFSVRKRRGIRQFSADLNAKMLERGYALNIDFITCEGNRNDFLFRFGQT